MGAPNCLTEKDKLRLKGFEVMLLKSIAIHYNSKAI